MDAGHNVHQVSDEVKNQVPEHIRKAAREMNRKAYKDRLREIQMSEHDAAMYEQFSSQVRKMDFIENHEISKHALNPNYSRPDFKYSLYNFSDRFANKFKL